MASPPSSEQADNISLLQGVNAALQTVPTRTITSASSYGPVAAVHLFE